MRFFAADPLTGEWLHRDLPLQGPEITWGLSGGDSLRATITPEIASMKRADGTPLLPVWGAAIYAEESGQIRWGGLLVHSELVGPDWSIECAGYAVYPSGLPYLDVYRRTRVDPLDAVREIWSHVQAQPDGDLGVVVDDTASDVVLGESGNLLPANVASGTDRLHTTEGFSSTGAALSSSTAFADEGRRSLKCDMGPSHSGGAEIFSIDLVRIGFETDYSFYGALSTGNSESQQDFEAGLTAEYFDSSRTKLGTVVHHERFSLPNGGDWRQFQWEGFSSAFPGTRYVRLSVFSADGDGDPVSVFADNLTLTEGTGTQEPYELVWWETPDCGQEIDRLAQETPFDFTVEYTWADESKDAVVHRLRLGYPRLGRRQHHLRFVEGENVAEVVAVTLDGMEFANETVAVGAGEGRRMLQARIPQRDGRLRRVHVAEDKSIRRRARLKAVARDALHVYRNLQDITRATVWADHPSAPFGTYHAGDDVLIEAHAGWADAGLWCRIVSITYRPGDGRVELGLTRSDRYSYQAGV